MYTRSDTASSTVPTSAPAAEVSRIEHLVGRLRQIPDDLRRFTVDERTALTSHRVDRTTLDTLVSAGLPYVGTGRDRLFDEYDIGNTALHLGLASVQRRAMRSWSGALRARDDDPGAPVAVEVRAFCPAPGHSGACTFDVLLPGGRRAMSPQTPGDVLTVVRPPPSARPAVFPAEVRDLLSELASVEFFLLPEAIRWDLDFLWRTRMADCGGATAQLVEEGARRGLETRFAFGLLVAKPYSTPHCWAEFRVDGRWTAADPLLIRALTTWAGLDPAAWPPHRSPGGVMLRLTDHFTKIAAHQGMWSPISLHTEYL